MGELILGLGHDVVEVAEFSRQPDQTGTNMRGLFSPREWRQAEMRAAAKHDERALHLAAKWAGKESVLKAWSEALGDRPMPYATERFPWAHVEILDDSRGRPRVVLDSAVEGRLHDSLHVGWVQAEETTGVRSSGSDDAVADGTGSAGSAGSADSHRTAEDLAWHISLSHDGSIASAVVMLIVRYEK